MTLVQIAVACAIQENYGVPALVMLRSLRDHLRPDAALTLYLVHRGLSRELLAAISSLADTRSIIPTAEQLSIVPSDAQFPREAAVPLLLPWILPQDLEQVLFLDVDTLVLDDIASLWETGTQGYTVAAVQDRAIPTCGSPRGIKGLDALSIPPDAPYFNAGVMLMDLPRWRRQDVTARALRYLRDTGASVDFLHQEALNAALAKDWHPLSPRWNLLASLAGRAHAGLEGRHWKDPGIVHFAGRFKPWRQRTGGPFGKRYRHYLAQVGETYPVAASTLADRLLGAYDRHARRYLYGLERNLWKWRLL